MKQNLLDEEVYHREREYALIYQKKSLLGKAISIIIVISAIIILILDKLGVELGAQIMDVVGLLSFILVFFGAIYILIYCRCPKCKQIQPAGYGGVEVGSGVGVSYSRGFTPFRKRCYHCGTYLSVKQLEKDRAKALREQECKDRSEGEMQQ